MELPPAPRLAGALRASLAERPARLAPGEGRRSAVLVLLYQSAGAPHLVLTKRTQTVAHPGQISFPGGRFEAQDLTLQRTAVRETEEEIGVDARAVELVGRLDDVPTFASNFVISPFVAVLAGHLEPVPDRIEVARVMEVPLADVLSADERLPHNPGLAELRYPLDSEDVWGATARILRDFTDRVRAAVTATQAASAPS